MRKRITVLAVFASTLAVLLFAVPLAFAVSRYLSGDERNELQRSAATVAAAVSGDLNSRAAADTVALEPGAQITVYGPSGHRLSGSGAPMANSLVREALSGRAGTGTGGSRLIAAAPVSDGDAVIAAVTVSTARHDLTRRIGMAWAEMAVAAVIAVALTALAARRYSRRLSAPLEQLAAAAHQIGDGNRTRAASSPIGELNIVAHALNDSADQLQATIARERQFTADASHQLRTPLAGLRLELEAAMLDERSDARAAIGRALTATDHLQATIEALLSVARDQSALAATNIPAVLDRLRNRWTGPLAAVNRPLRIDVRHLELTEVRCTPAALDQILDVLLDNAVQHGTGTVTVTVRQAVSALALDISNPGPAILTPTAELFRRRNPHASGHGIGLSLARSLTEADGGRLTLSSADPPVFTVLLPTLEQPNVARDLL